MTRPSPFPLIIVPAWNEEASVGAVFRESSASTVSAIRFLVRSMIVASARLQLNLPKPSESLA